MLLLLGTGGCWGCCPCYCFADAVAAAAVAATASRSAVAQAVSPLPLPTANAASSRNISCAYIHLHTSVLARKSAIGQGHPQYISAYIMRSGKQDRQSYKDGSASHAPRAYILLACICAAMAHSGERSYGRAPCLIPPGLDNPYMPSYKSHLYKHPVRNEPQQNIKANIVKEETTQQGLSVATISVTSWSPKIITMISKMAEDFDILLVHEHHKIRKKRT